MSMSEWANKEVEIACKKENPERKEGEFDYGCACYESALKAYNSLLEDGHSGMSMSLTKNILIRLIEGKPLTPIEDTENVWNYVGDNSYQCKRMSSLFKKIAEDGTVRYNDVDRVICVDVNKNTSYYSGFVDKLVSKKYPITMPYYPTKSIKVYCEDFLFDEKNGDFDTVGILKIELPSGEAEEINQYYKTDNGDYERIGYEEYYKRKYTCIDKTTRR